MWVCLLDFIGRRVRSRAQHDFQPVELREPQEAKEVARRRGEVDHARRALVPVPRHVCSRPAERGGTQWANSHLTTNCVRTCLDSVEPHGAQPCEAVGPLVRVYAEVVDAPGQDLTRGRSGVGGRRKTKESDHMPALLALAAHRKVIIVEHEPVPSEHQARRVGHSLGVGLAQDSTAGRPAKYGRRPDTKEINRGPIHVK